MDRYLIKKPSAWLPILLSLGMLALIACVWATAGLAREPDEGTPAHIFQLWLALEAILIAFFCNQMATALTQASPAHIGRSTHCSSGRVCTCSIFSTLSRAHFLHLLETVLGTECECPWASRTPPI
jgi:hypothetical protein